MSRLFLGVSAFIWIPYGLYCFFAPGFLAEAAGVSASTTTGTIELRAMYGGLQAALGILAAAACVRLDLVRPALVAIGFVCGGLFTARLLGALMAGEFSSYTIGGLVLEIVSAALAARLLAGSAEPSAA